MIFESAILDFVITTIRFFEIQKVKSAKIELCVIRRLKLQDLGTIPENFGVYFL